VIVNLESGEAQAHYWLLRHGKKGIYINSGVALPPKNLYLTAPILCISLSAQSQSRRIDEETIVIWLEMKSVLTSLRRKPTGVEICWALEPIYTWGWR
jgi:hypothetical protein